MEKYITLDVLTYQKTNGQIKWHQSLKIKYSDILPRYETTLINITVLKETIKSIL